MPLRAELSEVEIKRIADYQYAIMLEEDELVRRDGTGSEEMFQGLSQQLRVARVSVSSPFRSGTKPQYGLSDRELQKVGETIEEVLPSARAALARGDISFVEEELGELLDLFRINLDKSSAAYRRLGMEVLRRWVKALEVTERRHKGEVIETPKLMEPLHEAPATGGTVSSALSGWKKATRAAPMTVREFDHAVRRFIELHGDLPVADIVRRHVREYREALQAIPVRRAGALRNASLPELVEWSHKHPEVQKISAATVNKLLGGVQAATVWGRDNGLIPDDKPWADPFSRMHLDEGEPERAPWEIAELRTLFASPVFTQHARPSAGRGEAAYWLPLLGLFTGARQGELAPLTVASITRDEATGISSIMISEDEARGVRLKTTSSRRIVPVHPDLDRLGFLTYVEARRKEGGPTAALFPHMTPGPRGGYAEGWSKWFGRYIRSIGITNKDRVFHCSDTASKMRSVEEE